MSIVRWARHGLETRSETTQTGCSRSQTGVDSATKQCLKAGAQTAWRVYTTQFIAGQAVEATSVLFRILVGLSTGLIYITVLKPGKLGFDPIFYLHHCAVDRLVSLWSKIHGVWVPGAPASRGRVHFCVVPSNLANNLQPGRSHTFLERPNDVLEFYGSFIYRYLAQLYLPRTLKRRDSGRRWAGRRKALWRHLCPSSPRFSHPGVSRGPNAPGGRNPPGDPSCYRMERRNSLQAVRMRR